MARPPLEYTVVGRPVTMSDDLARDALAARTSWGPRVRADFRWRAYQAYGRLSRLGASPAELQDVAWATYLSNVYREDGSTTDEH